ncbi:hypothetical protein [Bacillus thuringiensis]|uniref:Uncharacterized protein n=2 Tax=Bacillus thuringiensis TaxID=1428 RepID=W8Y5F7_BACTU|nr:hypothetical protein [Bacillus thuringiensis]MBG9632683.1 NADH dehydrogenase [Bacillus thuringiensis]MBG9632695.1 NADH dehydrogenase [Bacillus thuringiensis]MBG9632699.1 NADH dehydrogenase [Bacillus thuringiensis]MBG9632703.1 NADH dehydrogenase [Bacillus thuringiensis]MBG9665032.1 NADH dehydrogenase [Bacillus thuringiensis]
MARAGKGDLADYGNVIKDKKESKKPVVPGFSDLADNEKINERQEILKQVQESNNDNIHESLPNHEHVHDNFTEQFLKQFSKKITKEDTHTRQTWLIKNETIKRLERLSKGKRKGFKTELVNQALEIFLHQIEK